MLKMFTALTSKYRIISTCWFNIQAIYTLLPRYSLKYTLVLSRISNDSICIISARV